MAAAQARDLSFLSTAQRPKQQGLSVMLTNALRSNSLLRFERTAQFTKRHQAMILPIGGAAEVSGRATLATNQVGVSKVQLGARHPLVAITPGDSFRRRMVRSTGMTRRSCETGSERIEYAKRPFISSSCSSVAFAGGRDRHRGLRAFLRIREFVFGLPVTCAIGASRHPARMALFYFGPTSCRVPGIGAIALRPPFLRGSTSLRYGAKLIGLTEGGASNSCYIQASACAHELMP
jgi:hypothetical protein